MGINSCISLNCLGIGFDIGERVIENQPVRDPERSEETICCAS